MTYVLAPKLKKNWRKAKLTMNAAVLRVLNLLARIPTAEIANRIVRGNGYIRLVAANTHERALP